MRIRADHKDTLPGFNGDLNQFFAALIFRILKIRVIANKSFFMAQCEGGEKTILEIKMVENVRNEYKKKFELEKNACFKRHKVAH